jgi:glycosyltransferase involved in cell wall biosynthesis
MGWFPDEPGGLNRYVRELFLALERNALSPRAIVLGPASDRPPTVTVPASRDEPLWIRLARYAQAASGAARTSDIVDAHFALYALLPVLGPLRRMPLVVHFHGPWAEESVAAGEGRASNVRLKRLVERSVYKRASKLVVLSGAFKRVLVERYGVSPWRVHVISPGIDLERFSPDGRGEARALLGIGDDAWVALAARRLIPRMGIDVLLEAWARLAPSRGDLVLLVVGEGPERTRLADESDRLGLADTVRFVGAVSDDELASCYRAADVCIVPSVALEGFGLVVLEALASGTPVVASDVGGLPETLASLDPSLVVPAGDSDALADRLRAALDGSMPLPPRKTCRSFAERFSWDVVATRHRDVYARARRPPGDGKVRVVYLDHCAKLSGAELALLRLLPALEDVDPHVILGEDGPLVSRLLGTGISVEVLQMPEAARDLPRNRALPRALPFMSVLGAAGYSARLARRLRQLQPDLVHTNSLKSALYGGVAARLAGIPAVWHIRDRIADDYLPAPAVRFVRTMTRWLPDALIANSQTTLVTLGAVRPVGIVVPSPVVVRDPLQRIGRAQFRDRDELRIGIIGRITPWKGQHVFLEAFSRAFPGGSERAVFVGAALFGESEEAYARQLRERASELGLDGRVEFRGFREDVESELARLDVLVHASVIPEPFGQVVIEGMGFGLPVVAAGAGGPAEVIEEGVNGLLYPPGDVDALAQALQRLASDAELRRRLGRAARDKANEFAPDEIAHQVMNLYGDVLTGYRRRGTRVA